MSFIVKNTTFLNPLDLIAPHSCRGCGALGKVICERCKNNIISSHTNFCPNCKAITPNGICKNCPNLPPVFTINHRNTIIGDLIHDFKYNSTRAIGVKLAEILHQTLPHFDGTINIVPLPTISRHIRERGLDHTLFIAKHLAKLRGKNWQVTPILERYKNTVQVGTNRKTRLKQAESAYSLSSKTCIDTASTYLLLDDVWTTGASMLVAIKKLQQAGVSKIIVAILAVS